MGRISLRRGRRWLALSLLVTAVVTVPAGPAQAATGGLDPSFGVNGRASVSAATDLAFSGDGKIWVSGASYGTSSSLDKVRLDRNGHADPAFRADPRDPGWESISGGETVVTPAGGAVTSWDECCNSSEPIEYVSLRYNTVSGSPASFGAFQQGYRAAPPEPLEPLPMWSQNGGGLIRLADGRFRICLTETYVTGQVVLWGLMPDGTPDTAVGPQGQRAIPGVNVCGTQTYRERERSLTRGLFLDRDGRIYVTGRVTDNAGTADSADDRSSVAIVRTDANGRVDTSYGTNGRFLLTSPSRNFTPNDVEVTQSGTAFLGMTAQDTTAGSQPAATIAKVTASGALDPAFGSGGLKRFTVAGGSTRVDSLGTLQGSRLAVAMTYIAAGQRTGRLTAVSATTAQPDRTFGSNGMIKTGLRVLDTAVQGTNGLLLAGKVMPSNPAIEPGAAVVERRLV